MENQTMLSQVVAYQKEVFDTSYDMAVTILNQRDRMVHKVFDQSDFFPESGRKLYDSWRCYFERNQDNCRQYIDDNFDRVKAFFEKPAGSSSEAPSDKQTP